MKTIVNLAIAIICLLGFCVVAVVFKVINLADIPISFIGAALGAVITGVITVVLLHGQSRAEEIKERNVKVFEKKSEIFQKYIDTIWRIWEDHNVSVEEYQYLISDYYKAYAVPKRGIA
jgi:uncharacterized membrane protein